MGAVVLFLGLALIGLCAGKHSRGCGQWRFNVVWQRRGGFLGGKWRRWARLLVGVQSMY